MIKVNQNQGKVGSLLPKADSEDKKSQKSQEDLMSGCSELISTLNSHVKGMTVHDLQFTLLKVKECLDHLGPPLQYYGTQSAPPSEKSRAKQLEQEKFVWMKEKAKMAAEIAKLKIELSNCKKKPNEPTDIDKVIPFPSKQIDEVTQLVIRARQTDKTLGQLIIQAPSIIAMQEYIGTQDVIKQLALNIEKIGKAEKDMRNFLQGLQIVSTQLQSINK